MIPFLDSHHPTFQARGRCRNVQLFIQNEGFLRLKGHVWVIAGLSRPKRWIGWEGETELVEGILLSLHGPGDGGQHRKLRSLPQARCGVQVLLGLQASLVLRGCMPEGGLEAPQEKVRAAGATAGRRCKNQRGTCNRGLAGGFAVGGANGRAAGSRDDDYSRTLRV